MRLSVLSNIATNPFVFQIKRVNYFMSPMYTDTSSILY
ncbi:hypothetical protein BMWSH_4740 [Priestia megaterium WSH-002]|uniref:Uncharacterized protein n=1 Tax=Priestia megaterium (strain WSH-002) TaxID=1006007 RepID=A0A8D3X3E9_PRIMW|nr:hypothetical protein BMWSH_4740 [Priestia megaterium WSH-002]